MRETKFTIDVYGDVQFDGFTTDEDWNGWACPYFTFEQAQRIVAEHQRFGLLAWYDADADKFVFSVEQGRVGEPDEFEAVEIDGRKLYPIGARCWIWEETADEGVTV